MGAISVLQKQAGFRLLHQTNSKEKNKKLFVIHYNVYNYFSCLFVLLKQSNFCQNDSQYTIIFFNAKQV